MDFDFDAWAKLAKDDPPEFERRRVEALREAIENAPPAFRHRLQRLQSRLDHGREPSAPSPAPCPRINSLLWVGFYRLKRDLAAQKLKAGRDALPRRSAQIIPFPGRFPAKRAASTLNGADG